MLEYFTLRIFVSICIRFCDAFFILQNIIVGVKCAFLMFAQFGMRTFVKGHNDSKGNFILIMANSP